MSDLDPLYSPKTPQNTTHEVITVDRDTLDGV